MNQTIKQFVKSGNYLMDEVKKRAEKGSPFFFNTDTMKYFSSRVSDLCWKVENNIYFITSEADKGYIVHNGSKRAFTVRKCDLVGDIETIGEFQEHKTLNDARKTIKEIIESEVKN